MIVLVMGPAAAGKSRVGAALAAALGARFVDGDDLHPPENVARMRAGVPLDEAARAPWLAALRRVVDEARARGETLVVAASLLARRHREVVAGGAGDVRLVFLDATRALLAARLAARRGHFFPPSLLDSQLAALERPDPTEALLVSAARPVDALVAEILRSLPPS